MERPGPRCLDRHCPEGPGGGQALWEAEWAAPGLEAGVMVGCRSRVWLQGGGHWDCPLAPSATVQPQPVPAAVEPSDHGLKPRCYS